MCIIMKQVLDNIVTISIIAFAALLLIYGNDEGIKEIHDKVTVIVPKNEVVIDEPVEDKKPPMYVIQPVKSI